jgi:peptidoglycan/LPS O-acetylase OafA/YrhL
MPPRIWELLLGALLASLPAATRLRRWQAEALSAVGLMAIVAVAIAYTPQTPFPGFHALWPCMGAGLFIYANAPQLTTTGHVLATRTLTGIGLVSYSYYLWHWPILVTLRQVSSQQPPWGWRLLAIVLGLFVSYLSWRYIEWPFRRAAPRISLPKALTAYVAASLALVLLCGLLNHAAGPIHERLSFAHFADACLPGVEAWRPATLRACDRLSRGRCGHDQLPPVGRQSCREDY